MSNSDLGAVSRMGLSTFLDPKAAQSLLCERLNEGSDGAALSAWLDEALHLIGRDDGAALALAQQLVTHLESRAVRSLRGSLTRIFDLLEKASPAHVDRGLRWICLRGERGDADAVADLMVRWVASGPQSFYVLGRFVNLTRWLLDYGTDRLSLPRHAPLLPFVVDVARHHMPERIELALCCVLSNEHGATAWAPGCADILWDGLELALRRGEGADILSDLLCLPGASVSLAAHELFAPFESNRPRARAELVSELARGELPLSRLLEGWTRAIRMDALPTGALDLGSLLACAEAMMKLVRAEQPVSDAWVILVGSELLRHMDGCRSTGDLAAAPCRLERLVAWPALQPGLRKALERALREEEESGFACAKSILATYTDARAVYAAVHALPEQKSGPCDGSLMLTAAADTMYASSASR